jgi:BirA family transcriptional regulator, biotin operon repressor / biotin---[acetyl-CoA-carboxylase] ligase
VADEASATSALDVDALTAGVAGLSRFGKVRWFDSVASTNTSAMALLDDDESRGLTIFAEEQTQGRGRAGRAWTSPRGSGLHCSTIVPAELPHEALPALGYWVSLCASDAITEACNVWTTLKWPNDLMLGASKASGVLVEGRTLGASTRAVVGIGINANRPPVVPDELVGVAAWLSDLAGGAVDRTALAVTLLQTYERRFDDLLARPVDVIREWARRSAIAGRRLRVHDAQGGVLHEGTARGLSDDGALLLETKDGPVAVRLGDVAAL